MCIELIVDYKSSKLPAKDRELLFHAMILELTFEISFEQSETRNLEVKRGSPKHVIGRIACFCHTKRCKDFILSFG